MNSRDTARKIVIDWQMKSRQVVRQPSALMKAIEDAIEQAVDPFKNCEVVHPETHYYEHNKLVMSVPEHCVDEDETRC